MGNILIDMMGLLTRKRVVKKTEETDFLVLGRRPNPDDSMFNTPKMYNELISIKDLKAEFDEGEISGGGTLNTIPLFTPDGTTLGDSDITRIDLFNYQINNSLTVPSNLTTTNLYVSNIFAGDTGVVSMGGNVFIGSDNTDVLTVNSETEFNGNVVFDLPGYAEFRGVVGDNTGSPGTAGQILSSTGTGVEWINVSGGGVTSIIAGTNVTISPANGIGAVTINASGGGGGITETKGNWTPQLIAMDNTSTPSPGFSVSSYSIRQGRWIRHGSLVMCEFFMLIDVTNITKSSPQTGSLTIQGWPYDASSAGSFQDARTMQCTGFNEAATNFTFTYNTSLLGNASINLNTPTVASNGVHGIITIKENNIPSTGSLNLQGVFAYETSSNTLNPGATIL